MSRCPKCLGELDAGGRCALCHYRVRLPSRFKRVALALAGLSLIYALVGLLLWHINPLEFENLLARITHRQPIYEISIQPPSSPVELTNPTLSVEQLLDLRRLFEKRNFAELAGRLEGLQREFEADHLQEHKVVDAFRVFGLAREDYQLLLDAWAAEYPDHFAPYLARAQYQVAMGWQSRGTGWYSETPQRNLRAMRGRFDLALADLERALALNPRLLPAYQMLISLHNAKGEDYLEDQAFERGRQLFPESRLLFGTMLWAKEPRWGGSFSEMETLALQGYAQVGANPEMPVLLGSIYLEQARVALGKEQYRRALKLCNKALAYAQKPSFFRLRGRIYDRNGELEKALADYDASAALGPTVETTYEYRWYVRSRLGDREGAMEDVFRAWQLTPQKPALKEAYRWASMLRLHLEDERRPKKIMTAVPTTTSFEMRPASALHIKQMFRAPEKTKPCGLTWAAGYLYLSSYGDNPGIYRIDPGTGQVVGRFRPEVVIPGWYGGLGSDGSDIFHVQTREGRHAARLSGEELVLKERFFFNCPESKITDIAVLDGSIWAIGTDDFMDPKGFKLMRFTLDGDLQEAYQYHHEVDKHAFNCGMTTDGRWLYVASWDKLIKVDPTTGNIMEKYPLRLYNIFGLAWDGEAIWAASFLGPVYRIKLDRTGSGVASSGV